MCSCRVLTVVVRRKVGFRTAIHALVMSTVCCLHTVSCRMSIRSASLQLTQLDGTTVNVSACVAFPESSHNSVRVEDVHKCFEGITLGQAWLLDAGDRAIFIGGSGLSSVPFSETSVNRLKGKSGAHVLVGGDSTESSSYVC